jgi:hypothetical protein
MCLAPHSLDLEASPDGEIEAASRTDQGEYACTDVSITEVNRSNYDQIDTS